MRNIAFERECEFADQSLKGNGHPSQGAATPFHLSKKFSDTKTCIFWCKTIWGIMFTKGVLPLVGEPH